jgi:peptidyl-prolyl cis-trans isomerase SurA
MIRGRPMPRGVRVAALVLPAVLAGAARAEVTDRIVATIDGEPVTTHELRRYVKERKAENTPESRVLEALITDKLLEKEIKAQGITARDDEIDRYVEEIQQRNGMDRERFQAALATQGLTLETYRARVKSELEKAALVNREIRQHVNVSPEEIRRYYDAHLGDYATAERVQVRDIFLAIEDPADEASVARARSKAIEVRGLAQDGHDFGALAEQFSEGPGAKKGGELGTFGRGELEHDLEQAAFALEAGKVSEPVRAGGGFHLLRVDERMGAGHKPLAEVQDDIRDALYNQALEDRFQNWLSHDLRERHHVEVLD